VVSLAVGRVGGSGSGRIVRRVLSICVEPIRQLLLARPVVQAAQLLGVAIHQAPFTALLMLATKLLTRRGIITRLGPVTHRGHLRPGKELQLPHATIIAHAAERIDPISDVIMPDSAAQ